MDNDPNFLFARSENTPKKMQVNNTKIHDERAWYEKDAVITELQQQIQHLTEELNKLKSITQAHVSLPSASSVPVMEYHTDEDEVARETEWIRVKAKKNKKRKLNEILSPPSPISEVTETRKVIIQKEKKLPAPPPLMIDGIKSFEDLFTILSESMTEEDFHMKITGETSVKLNIRNQEKYRIITKILKENNAIWHTYENKQTRPIKVIVKNLHHTCKTESIKNYLIQKNFKVIEVVNKLSYKTKMPLNIFMITFENEEIISQIFEIKYIMGYKIEVHPLRKSRLIPQCKICQAFGHTKKFCSKEPRCVKCAKKHLTIDCSQSKEERPKCYNCGEAHVASYRGCLVAKELQKIKDMNLKKTKTSRNNNNNQRSEDVNKAVKSKVTINKVPETTEISYANIVKGHSTKQKAQKSDNDVNVNQTLQIILAKMINLEKSFTTIDEKVKMLESSNKKTATKPKNK